MMRIASASSTRWARLAPRRRRVTREEIKGSSGWVLASETRYVYDGMRVIQERNINGVPTVAYTRGPDLSGTLEGAGGIGGLLARSEWNSASSTWSHAFYHSDGVGNVTALAVPNGNDIALAGSYRYDPFGRLIGTPTDLAARNTQRFSSKEWHNASGFYHFGYRFYDPATQRWLNRDPIGEEYDVNLYRYVYNLPLNYVDPDGLWGIQFGDFNIGWGDPNLAFDSDSWNDLGQGAAATADGLIPFSDPFKDKYDPCAPIFAYSYAGGEIAQNAFLTAAGLRAASWLGGTRLGHGLNHNPYLRIGPGRMPRNGAFPPSTGAPRISIGPQRPGVQNPHIDLRIRPFDL